MPTTKKFMPDDFVEPSWLKEVSPNSTLSVRDMSKLFGITMSTVYSYYLIGKLPMPDLEKGYSFGKPVNPMMGSRVGITKKSFWRVSTIRKFIKEFKEKPSEV